MTFRKHYVGYLKGLPNIATVRSDLMQYTTMNPVIERLQKYLEESTIHEKIWCHHNRLWRRGKNLFSCCFNGT